MNKFIYLACLFFVAACSENKVANESTTTNTDTSFSVDGKEVIVYTTADSTDYRLSPIDTLSFANFDQPLETQPCIFVDPSHTFQTFLGVGGALTDAAAETFAKLPADRQKEILQAYYDKDKGIGYSIGRTNINSCDFSSDMRDDFQNCIETPEWNKIIFRATAQRKTQRIHETFVFAKLGAFA